MNYYLKNNILGLNVSDIFLTIKLPVYIEGMRDIFDSEETPSIIQTRVVFNKRSAYLILKFSIQKEYERKHIEYFFCIPHEELYELLKNSTTAVDAIKIVIISGNGQVAVCFTPFLDLALLVCLYFMNYRIESSQIDFTLPCYYALRTYTNNILFDNYKYYKSDSVSPEAGQSEGRLKITVLLDDITSFYATRKDKFLNTLPYGKMITTYSKKGHISEAAKFYFTTFEQYLKSILSKVIICLENE